MIRRPRTTPRVYVLRGVLFCGICHRQIQGSWNNNQPYYRCTYPNEYAQANNIHHPRVVYVREAEIVPELDAWLGKVLDPAHLPQTIDALAAAQHEEIPPEVTSLRDDIALCDRQLAQYRAALDSGGAPPSSASGSPRPKRRNWPPKRACAPAPPHKHHQAA